jgi:multiple sugar transport system substrate-binding protein
VTLTLKGITWDHPRGYQPLIACSTVYEADHDVRITWEWRSLKDFGDQPIDQLAATYDLLVIDHPHTGLAAATGCLTPFDNHLSASTLGELAAQSAGESHASYTYYGSQWALALDAACQVAVYRADLIEQPALDTWEAVVRLGETVRQRGRTIAHPLGATDAICSFITLCASLGEPVGISDGLVSKTVGASALNLLQAIARVSHPESVNWNPIALLDYMSNHDDVVYSPLTFGYTNYSRAGYAPHRLTFTTIPGIRGSILGGTGLAVSSRCQHPQPAADFSAWLCSAPVQAGPYVRAGGQPANRAAWEDAEANALTGDFFRNTLPTLDAAGVRPRHHGFTTFQAAAGVVINAYLRDATSTQDCLATLSALYDGHR